MVKKTQLAKMGQMEKTWYLYLSNHYRGPFSSMEVRSLLKKRLIRPINQVWKEGFSQWVALGDIPELVDLPQLKARTPQKGKRKKAREENVVWELVSSMDKAALNQGFIGRKLRMILSKDPLYYFSFWKDQTIRLALSGTLFFLFSLALLLELPSSSFYGQELYKGMSPRKYHQISALLDEGRNGFVLSEDEATLWYVSDRDSSTDLTFEFSSVPGSVLSVDKIIFHVTGKLRDHVATFTEFHFDQGTRLIPGQYQLVGYEPRNHAYFQQWDNDKINKLFDTRLFIKSGLTEQEFNKQLAAFNLKLKERDQAPFKEILENHQTLAALLTHTEELFRREIMRIKKGESISFFANTYAREGGILLGDLTVDHLKTLGTLSPSSSQVLREEYGILIKQNKEIGLLIANLVEEVGHLKELTPESKKYLLKKYSSLILATRDVSLKKANQLASKFPAP